MKEKEFLFGSKIAMISELGLLLELLPLLQLSFVRESNSVDSLQRIVGDLTQPVGGGGFDRSEGLEMA
jgi:hypothetical protein